MPDYFYEKKWTREVAQRVIRIKSAESQSVTPKPPWSRFVRFLRRISTVILLILRKLSLL